MLGPHQREFHQFKVKRDEVAHAEGYEEAVRSREEVHRAERAAERPTSPVTIATLPLLVQPQTGDNTMDPRNVYDAEQEHASHRACRKETAEDA